MIFLLAPFSNKAGIKDCITAIKDAFNRLKETPRAQHVLKVAFISVITVFFRLNKYIHIFQILKGCC